MDAILSCPLCGSVSTFDPADPSKCPRCGATLQPVPRTNDSSAAEPGVPVSGTATLVRTDTDQTGPVSNLRLPGFEIRGEIGRGGMGIVYRGWQHSVQRHVALKVLPPLLAADPHRLERFHQEARVAASLTDSHVVPVFDVVCSDGVPVLVMPYIEGIDLSRVLRDRQTFRKGEKPRGSLHPWATLNDRDYLAKVLPVLDQLVDAVAVVHQGNVLHRDLKPSNVLVDVRGHVWLADFGLARLVGEESGAGTTPGAMIGTLGYVSPEQADAPENVDRRSDLFALGVTLYQALTLELPFGRKRVHRQTPVPSPPSKLQRLLSRDFDAVILKAIDPDRGQRYQTAAELQADWRNVRQGLLPQVRPHGPIRRMGRWIRRRPFVTAATLLFAVLITLVAVLASRPTDPTVRHEVNVVTEPSGARVALIPFDEFGELDPASAIDPRDERSPLVLPKVKAGRYLVVAEIPGRGFHEVYREVPAAEKPPVGSFEGYTVFADGAIELEKVYIPVKNKLEDEMVRFKGGEFEMGTDTPRYQGAMTVHTRRVAPFFLDRTEVSVRAYAKAGPLALQTVLRRYEAPPKDDRQALVHISFNEAALFAERTGKRLCTEAEYEFAATLGDSREFPWGNTTIELKKIEWGPHAIDGHPFDFVELGGKRVYGLFSNVAEWTDSILWPYDLSYHPRNRAWRASALEQTLRSRVVRGAPLYVIRGGKDPTNDGEKEMLGLGPRYRAFHLDSNQNRATIGFRCARSAAPRFPENLPTPPDGRVP